MFQACVKTELTIHSLIQSTQKPQIHARNLPKKSAEELGKVLALEQKSKMNKNKKNKNAATHVLNLVCSWK